MAQWQKITSDPWILDTIQGYSIDFVENPIQKFLPGEIPFNDTEKVKLDKALKELQEAGVISPCTWKNDGFCSNIFGRTKKDGSVRIILNLSKLNEFVENCHFKMETIRDAIVLMRPGCYFGSIDFTQAYFSIPIARSDRKYFMFMWNGMLFRFNALPQGLSSAPRTFTKLMKAPFSTLREKGFTVLGYIDDSIFIEDESHEINEALETALKLFDGLGLTINVQKSVLKPVQTIEYLGFVLDSVNMSVTLTATKQMKIKKLADKLLKSKHISIQELAEFIGNVVAAEHGVYAAPLYYKRLEIERNQALAHSKGNYDHLIKLSEDARQDVLWWFDNITTLSRDVNLPEPDLTIESDASKKGWGASCDGNPTNITTNLLKLRGFLVDSRH